MDEKYDGLWVLVTADNKRYLGRIVEYGPVTYEEDGLETEVFAKINEEKAGDTRIVEAYTLVLSPILDFQVIEIPEQGPNGLRMSTHPFVKVYDFTGTPEARLYINPTTLLFIDELPEENQKNYREFIKQGLSTALKTQQKPLIELLPPGAQLAPHTRR